MEHSSKNLNEIIKVCKQHGLIFSTFSLSSVGKYYKDDADWNYKDVPHLKEMHKQVDDVVIKAEDRMMSSIFFQKIFGLTKPKNKNTKQNLVKPPAQSIS